MTHASINHLAGGTANSTSAVGDSLLRADWPASPRAAGSAGRDVTIEGCFTAWQSFSVPVNSVLHWLKSDTCFLASATLFGLRNAGGRSLKESSRSWSI